LAGSRALPHQRCELASKPNQAETRHRVTYTVGMGMASEHHEHELVVAADGTIPAEQLARIGAAPGAHLRVVQATPAGSIAGSLPDFPDLTWEDFERGSELASRDLTAS
jgi:hypothetical protein